MRAACKHFALLTIILLSSVAAQSAAATTNYIKIAVCQIVCLDGDRAGNFVRMENALAEAREKGADLACFPESPILGWVNPDAHQRAYAVPGPDSERLCDLAKKYRMYICSGISEKDGDKLYDAAVLVSDEGKLLLKHRKMDNLDNDHLIEPPYTSGETVQAVDTRFGKIGVLICADTFADDRLRRMAALEPDLLLVPYGWVGAEKDWPRHGQDLINLVRHVAQTVGTPAVGVDSVGQVSHGPWAGMMYGGFSNIANAQGNAIAVAKDRDRDVMVVQVRLRGTKDD